MKKQKDYIKNFYKNINTESVIEYPVSFKNNSDAENSFLIEHVTDNEKQNVIEMIQYK